MISNYSRVGLKIILGLWLAIGSAAAEPITSPQYERLLEAQNVPLQHKLELRFPESQGYLVTGPLDFRATDADGSIANAFSSVRVVCPDLETYTQIKKQATDTSLEFYPTTFQQLRWLIWVQRVVSIPNPDTAAFVEYSVAVWHYLNELDYGQESAVAPASGEYGLPAEVDFYAPVPDYVIQGYDDYKAYLREHAEIETDFATGILAFVPTDATLTSLKTNAPRAAYPNQEAARMQHEFREFFARGGDMRTIRTLTKDVFGGLAPGEYFFGVNASGKVRFGKEMLREEIERIEKETGHKAPRANHAFLFPGEPLLTAGAFFVTADPEPRIHEVVANSGHYFYSNIVPSIHEDVSERSDTYLATLGHFFSALDSLGIPYDGVLIRKF